MGELCWFLFSGARPGHSSGCWIAPRRQEAVKNGWRVTRSSKHFHLEWKKQLLVKETLHLKFSKTFNSLVEGLCLFLEDFAQWKPTLGGGFKIWLMCGDWLSNFDKHVSTGWFNHKNNWMIWMIKQNDFTSWGVWPITMELEPAESGWWVA